MSIDLLYPVALRSLLGLAMVTAATACVADDPDSTTDPTTSPSPGDTDPSDTDPGSPLPGITDSGDPQTDTDPGFDTDTDTDPGDTDTVPTSDCQAATPSPQDGFVLDFGDWTLATDINGQAEWAGPCVIMDVQAGAQLVTAIDCSAAPNDGPALATVSFDAAGQPAGWAAGQMVDVAYTLDGWSDGERFTVRDAADAALLFTVIDGGGDGGLPLEEADLAPLSVSYDLNACSDEVPNGEGDPGSPVEVTFTEPDGTTITMLHGEEATLSGPAGEQYWAELHLAIDGQLDDHYGSFVDIVIHRLQ